MEGGAAFSAVGVVTASGVGCDVLFDDLLTGRLRYSMRQVGLADTGRLGRDQDAGDGAGDGGWGTPGVGPAVYGAHAGRPPVEDFVPARAARAMGRDGILLCHAGLQAVTGCGLAGRIRPERIGVTCATISAGLSEYLAIHDATLTPGSYVNPTWGPQLSFNAPAALLSIHAGATGPHLTLSAGDTAGLDAILRGADYLAAGQCDAVIAGGVDTVAPGSGPGRPVPVRVPYAGDAAPSLPGDAGAALVMVRPADADGGPSPALGYLAAAAETTADPCGGAEGVRAAARAAVECALAGSGMRAGDLGLVMTSSSAADPARESAECLALHEILSGGGPASGGAVPVGNVTATTGRAAGADGVLAVLVALEALRRNAVPPMAGTGSPAATLPPLSFARTAGRPLTAPTALVLGVERSGQARALIVSHPSAWRKT